MISASYHLDKSNNTKSGGIYLNKINQNETIGTYTIDKKENFISLDYGVLEYKINKSRNLLFTANSNCTFSIFSINNIFENSNIPFKFKVNTEIAENVNDNCCNYIELNKFNEQQVLLAMNDGSFHFFDINKQEKFFNSKGHQYGLWSTFIVDENTFLTGSEDSILKMWDLRSKSW